MTNHHKEIIPSIHHTVLDQITEITATPATKTHKIDKDSTEIAPEIRDTNKYQDTIRGTKATRTTKTETGLITEEDQINTNTIEINTKHKSFLNFRTKT